MDTKEWEQNLSFLSQNGDLFHKSTLKVETDTPRIISSNHSNKIVQFCTGLKDSNCKEIYEGDILEERFGSNDIHYYKVEWVEDGWFLIILEDNWDAQKALSLEPEAQPRMSYFYKGMRIVGNIFENPEYLTS